MTRWHFTLAFCLAACEHQPPTVEADSAPPAPSSSAAVDAGGELVMGPTGSFAPVDLLLAGALEAGRFPLVATDDGGPVDYWAREELTPRPSFHTTVKIVKLQLPSGMEERAVREALSQRFGAFIGCMWRARFHLPYVDSQISVRVTLDERGAVQSVEDAGSPPSHPYVLSCVIQRTRSTRFPKPSQAGASLGFELELKER